eukprot:UN01588
MSITKPEFHTSLFGWWEGEVVGTLRIFDQNANRFVASFLTSKRITRFLPENTHCSVLRLQMNTHC